MIAASCWRSTVTIYDNDEVVKTYKDRLMFLKEKFAYETFPELCANVISIEDMVITLQKGISLRQWLDKKPSEQDKAAVKFLIIKLLRDLHSKGYVHCDCHIDNVILYPNPLKFDVRLIDFEHLRCKSQERFEDDIDVKGGGYICAFDGSPRSIKTNLGGFV
jgi:serine/threonine protein kinase